MYFGLPVIAGNKDGSVDALLNAKLGLLVNPLDVAEIEQAILKIIENNEAAQPDSTLLMDYFGYEGYKKRLFDVLM
jgi:phosphatidylinositol alpha-1,6-mannosyltransferase